MNLNKLFNYHQPLPVILGGYVNALGLARSLGEKGLPSLIIDYKKNIAFCSKYSVGIICPDPNIEEDNFINFLIEIGSKIKNKGFFLTTNDVWLIPISKKQNLLEKYYFYPMSSWETISTCIDKTKLYEFANKEKIPYSKSYSLKSIRDIETIKNQITYPCILKPSITVNFAERLKSTSKVFFINSLNELDTKTSQILDAGLDEIPLIVQEYIPGGAENLYTLTAYSNKHGDIIAYSTGHKIRQFPPDAGTIISGRVTAEPEIYDLGKRLIKSVGFYGISNTEFKKDPRDGTFKLIEINPRPGMWNYSVQSTGLNLPYMAYQEITGEKLNFIGTSDKELVWLMSVHDLYYSLYGFKKIGYDKYSLSFSKWRKSVKGKKVDAIFSTKDIMPGLMLIIDRLFKLIKKIMRNPAKRKFIQ